jgi:hypothetical protein
MADTTYALATATAALLGTYLVIFYPALRPYIAQRVPALATPMWENLFLPLVLYRCLELSSLMATPTLGALTPLIVAVGYLCYLHSFRCIHDYIVCSEEKEDDNDSSSDETSGSSSSEENEEPLDIAQASGTSSEENEEPLDIAQAQDAAATSQEEADNGDAAIVIPPVTVEGQSSEDVFTVLAVSQVNEQQSI